MAKLRRFDQYFVYLHGWYEDLDATYLAMDYLPLGDLSKHLTSRIVEREVQDITRQLLSGLQAMHRLGFTHRDLKPHNVFIVSKPAGAEWIQPHLTRWQIRIGDFGITKGVQNEGTELLTMTGTRPYMAPEMFPFLVDDLDIDEPRPYTQAVDVWALGVLVFQMHTLGLPFGPSNPMHKYFRGISNFPDVPLHAASVSPEAIEFIKPLLQPLAAERPTSSEALEHAWLSDGARNAADDQSLDQEQAGALPAQQVAMTQSSRKETLVRKPSATRNAYDRRAYPLRSLAGDSHHSAPTASSEWATDVFPETTAEGIVRRSDNRAVSPQKLNSIEEQSVGPAEPSFSGTAPVVPTVQLNDSSAYSFIFENQADDRPWSLYEAANLDTWASVPASNVAATHNSKLAAHRIQVKDWVETRTDTSHNVRDRLGFPTQVRSALFEGASNVPEAQSIMFDTSEPTTMLGSSRQTLAVHARHTADTGIQRIYHLNTKAPAGPQFGAVTSSTNIIPGASTEPPIDWQRYKIVGNHGGFVYSAVFSPDGQLLASASTDNTVRLWTTAGTEFKRLDHKNQVLAVTFSPNGKLLASGSFDSKVRIWHTNGVQIGSFSHDKAIWSVAFSPDGQLIASASFDNTVCLWSVEGGAMKSFKHDQSVQSVAFSPDGLLLASGSFDRTVRLWDIEKGIEVKRLEGHAGAINSTAFSPDGLLVVSASNDKTVRLWDVATGAEIKKLTGHSNGVYSVAFSPDGRLVVSGSRDKTLRLWNVATGLEAHKLEGHDSRVQSVAFSRDGRLVVSGSDDKTVRLWGDIEEDGRGPSNAASNNVITGSDLLVADISHGGVESNITSGGEGSFFRKRLRKMLS